MSKALNQLKRVVDVFRDAGLSGLARLLATKKYNWRQAARYQEWLEENGTLTDAARVSMKSAIDALKHQPLISVILPVFNVDEKWLRLCIESVLTQIYDNWELCLADDASTVAHIKRILNEYAAQDKRIKVVFRSENGHISAASNSALELATGEFVVLLDHDDELAEDALYWVAKEINEFPDAGVIYSDEDLIDQSGRRFGPKFKPDFSRDLLYSLNLLTHLSAFRAELIRSVGGFRIGFEGSQDYDLSLRAIEKIDESQIRHIPRILYHWRVIEGSVAFSMDEKPYAHERARNAIRDHFARTGVSAEVVASIHNLHRVQYSMPAHNLFVSQIVTGGSPDGIPMTFDHEIITVEHRALSELKAAAANARGDVLLFVDSDLSLNDGSIDELVATAMQPGIGAAGARILAKNQTVETAGIILRDDLSPGHAHHGFWRKAVGNMYRNRQIGNFSAVSMSCLAIRRELFESVGGFEESGLLDVDLCLRLRKGGFRIVMLPHVELMRFAARADSQLDREELAEFRKRWPEYVALDPFCNPNLKRDGSFEIDL